MLLIFRAKNQSKNLQVCRCISLAISGAKIQMRIFKLDLFEFSRQKSMLESAEVILVIFGAKIKNQTINFFESAGTSLAIFGGKIQIFHNYRYLMSRANDIYENRIEKVLSAMDSIKLYALPKSEPWTLDRFLEEIKDACKDAAADLNRKSVMIEDAVEDLIGLALQALNLPDPEADENGVPSMGSSAVSPADRYLLELHIV